MTPKLYSRIQRLRRVVEQLTRPDEPDWASLANEHGYYDQPHLIRDFREFSGVTPARYRPLPGVSPLHMKVAEP
jgi:AraC-like DNA-binding protein